MSIYAQFAQSQAVGRGISPGNRAASISRDADGSMGVVFGDGRTGKLSAEDEEIQAFLVFTMIHAEELEGA